MIGHSLHRFTLLSLIIHIVFVGFAMLSLKRTSHFLMPSPYVVDLVGTESLSVPGPAKVPERVTAPGKKPSEASLPPQRKEPKVLERAAAPGKKPSEAFSASQRKESQEMKRAQNLEKMNEQYFSEVIAAIEAKKKIERIGRLREVITLRGGGEGKAQALQGSPAKREGSVMDAYYVQITKEIWQHWVFPDTGVKNIETVVSVRIFRDGSVQVQGIEKSSGNPLFDRSALKAVVKASPLTPPPYEMEIGVRFYP
jgi:colicin import membrane protein